MRSVRRKIMAVVAVIGDRRRSSGGPDTSQIMAVYGRF